MQGDSSSSGQPQSGQAQQQGESGQRRDSAEGPREGEAVSARPTVDLGQAIVLLRFVELAAGLQAVR